jgi:TRAP-type C4-dicarboxylate transport system permease small subunit
MKTLTILLAIVLIILIYYQYYYMQTDWCSAEIDILKSQISDIWYMYNLDMEVINE